jgi:hypothetical protein
MTQINLQLSIEEVNFVLEALGECPTKSGAINIMLKIREQGIPQVPEELKQKE